MFKYWILGCRDVPVIAEENRQTKSLSVRCKEWVTHVHHTQLEGKGVRSFCVEILKVKMQFNHCDIQRYQLLKLLINMKA